MLPNYNYNAMLDFSPITNAMQTNRANAMADEKLGMEREKFGMHKQQFEADQQLQKVKRWGMQSKVIDDMPDGQQKQAFAQKFWTANQDLAAHVQSKGIDPTSPHVWKILQAEAGVFDPDKRRETDARIEASKASAAANRAHAGYYGASTRAINAKTDAAMQPAAQPQSQPLADAYGMTEDGQIVPPSQQPQQSGFSLPQGGNVPRLPGPASASGVVIQGQQQRPPGMMRLGGPRDDIDASMRLDEGRRFGPPQGVQLAQGRGFLDKIPPGKQTPDIPNFSEPPRQPQEEARPTPDGSPPSLMQQELLRLYGGFGQIPADVRGVVTKPQGGATDVPATREAAGQRAYMGATPDQQDRYRKFRQEQQLWTSAYGKPARAGYYYGPRGEELAMSDRVYKGDAETAGLMKHNMQIIDEASKVLLNTSLPVQAVAGTIGYGETARALSDLEGAATQIAFTLSGKSVSNAERQEFMNRYAPKPMDSNYTINHKVGRMKQFYQALIDAKKSGVDDRAAWDMATKTTQTTPAPNNPAKGLSDDELLKELNK